MNDFLVLGGPDTGETAIMMTLRKTLTLFSLSLLYASGAFGQSASLEGWQRSMSDSIPDRVIYVNTAQQMFAYFHPLQNSDQTSLDRALVEQILNLDNADGCPGLSKGQGKLHANGTIKEASLGACTIFVGKGPKGGFYAVGMHFGNQGGKVRDAVIAIISAEGGPNVNGAAIVPSQKVNIQSGSGGAAKEGDGALQAAMASIPAANRPIDMVLISEWDSVAMSMAYKPRIIFANGYAVDDCAGWDMAKIAPTPSALKAIGSDCLVERWKKIGSDYVFQDNDGDWSEPSTSGTEIKGFRNGQRVDVDKSYVGGGGQLQLIPGGSSFSHANSGTLNLTTAGAVTIGNWFSNSIYTRNVQTTGSNAKSVVGRYYLDGYLIAVQAADGSISFGTIGQKQEDKLYIYMNGELYW